MKYKFNTKTYKQDDTFIKTRTLGNGKLVILVHGWPETWYSWRHQINPISDLGYKVIAINMRGYEGSYTPKEVEKYDMLSLIKDIINIINKENAKKAILIGHDWGAPICWNTAALNPNKVQAVIGLSVPYTKRGKISRFV